ncbi:Protein Eyes Shut [Manis pentadactyla]|nr:Protein Eyes Shut [Manis pentadactyla]
MHVRFKVHVYNIREGFEGEHCEINMNECFSFPCQNYGDCKDGVNNFRFLCNCEPEYHGSFCELLRNECGRSPCLDEEYCVNRTDGYNCLCVPGYTDNSNSYVKSGLENSGGSRERHKALKIVDQLCICANLAPNLAYEHPLQSKSKKMFAIIKVDNG